MEGVAAGACTGCHKRQVNWVQQWLSSWTGLEVVSAKGGMGSPEAKMLHHQVQEHLPEHLFSSNLTPDSTCLAALIFQVHLMSALLDLLW